MYNCHIKAKGTVCLLYLIDVPIIDIQLFVFARSHQPVCGVYIRKMIGEPSLLPPFERQHSGHSPQLGQKVLSRKKRRSAIQSSSILLTSCSLERRQ